MLCHDPLVLFSNRRVGLGGFLVNACRSRILKARKTLLDWRLKGVTGNYEQSDSSPISVQTNLRLMNGGDLWNLSSNDSENLNSHMNLWILFGKYPVPGNGTHLLWNKYFGTTFWISVILVRIKAVNHVNRVNYVTKSDHPRLWSREDLFHSITNVAT